MMCKSNGAFKREYVAFFYIQNELTGDRWNGIQTMY